MDVENQKYGGCISAQRFFNLNLDFTQHNVNEKKSKYRSILEDIFHPDHVKNSYIAGGGYLIHYKQDCPASVQEPEQFNQFNSQEKLQVYIKYLNEHSSTEDSKRALLNDNYHNLEIGIDDYN